MLNWLFRLIPIATTCFTLYVLWVVIRRHRLDIKTHNLAATGDYFHDPLFSIEERRDITAIGYEHWNHYKVIYVPCKYQGAQVTLRTSYSYYNKRNHQFVVLKF